MIEVLSAVSRFRAISIVTDTVWFIDREHVHTMPAFAAFDTALDAIAIFEKCLYLILKGGKEGSIYGIF